MEDISTAAIEVLVQNLINVFKEERTLIRGLDQDADQLQTTLGIIKGYLKDAERKSIQEHSVKAWLSKLEAVAFDADNALDQLTYHLLHKKIKKMYTPMDTVLLCFSSFTHIARPRNMALKIKEINANFESMNTTATELGLQKLVSEAPVVDSSSFETDSVTLDPIFIGRGNDVPKLVKELTNFPKERVFSILAIVGMGGMGKTTLTRKVFNHEGMKTRFGSLIWVHVSQTFDPKTLFKKILSTLPSVSSDSDGEVETKEVILQKLREALKGKTYLLVLDDVWNEDLSKWEEFINSLSGATSTEGNAIMMSTRNDKVALMVSPHHVHELERLSDEDCWSIIRAKAFENGQVPSSKFEVIGTEIAKRCQGLPLAANVVGGVLRSKSEEEWVSINKNWLSDDEGGENISKILKLSYDHLPSPSLKKCFAYCSIFPKGEVMKKQRLIEMWMAEGYLQPNERNEMESVGNKFLNVLLQNSLLLVSRRDYYGNAERFSMHDLVHDLARSVLGSSRKLYSYREERSAITKEVAKHLRTLVFEARISHSRFLDFECLHVLILGEKYRISELPSSVRKLIHLRLLDISETYISNLPEWIGEFHHLQTLRAKATFLMKLPSTLKYLINLRHLYINSYVKLPAEIGRLTCLQTLKKFRVRDKKGYKIEELGSLNNLRGDLEISRLDLVHDKEEALKANMFQKPNLFNLTYQWDGVREGETSDESVLEGLQPYSNIEELRIEGFMGKKFPLWTEKMAVRDEPEGSWVPLNKLIQITLIRCSKCEEIPRLDHLPNLKFLYLIEMRKVRFINSSFTKLTRLCLRELDELECLPHWLFHNNPDLLELEIACCPKLTELPDGISTLKSLEDLKIYKCRMKSIGNNSGGQSQLRELSIWGCEELIELPPEMVESWAPSLEILSLEDLSSLKNLPVVLDCLSKSATCLRELKIVGVPKIMATCGVESWPFGSLREIEIDVGKEEWSRENSDATKETVDGMLQGCLNSLSKLKLKGMADWDSLPESIQYLTSMEKLHLENAGVKELPEWFGNLSSLKWLYLYSCHKLRRLPSREAFDRLPQSKYLFMYIRDCPELCIDSELRKIPRLRISVSGT